MRSHKITVNPVNEDNSVVAIKEDQTLDAKGLNCPLPILKTKVLLNKMQPGEILYVEATDPHSVIDFEAYCARTNHRLLDIEKQENLFKFYIQRADSPNKI
jgi:tRNA 2-thiouridine synthesizing protein A